MPTIWIIVLLLVELVAITVLLVISPTIGLFHAVRVKCYQVTTFSKQAAIRMIIVQYMIEV